MDQPQFRPSDPASVEDMVANVMSIRRDFLKSLTDPRRDVYAECGLPTGSIGVERYYTLYDREAIAARVCEVVAREAWKVIPEVYEDDDPNLLTPFEAAWADLPLSLSPTKSHFKTEATQGGTVWEYLRRLDEQCGIGRYGVLLLGIDDGRPLWEAVEGVEEEGAVSGPQSKGALDKEKGTDPEYQWGWESWGGTGKAPRKQYNLNLRGAEFGRQYVANFAPPAGPPKPTAAPAKAIPRTDDPYAKPAGPTLPPPFKSKTPLRYLRVFPEVVADIVRFETNRSSPRFGQPLEYLLTLNDPRFGDQYSGIGLTTNTVRVHWTRVIHLADNVGACEWAGTPRMQQVYNNLVGLQKLYCGSPEMYWRGAFPGLAIETHPQLGGDVNINKQDVKDKMEQYQNGLQRYLLLMGMSAKTLSPQVVDPTPQINAQIQGICMRLAIPQRVFMGSERGELASGQDDDNWNDRLGQRHKDFCTPKVVIPFVDRLISLGVLPPPQSEETGLKVEWPSLSVMPEDRKAAVALQQTQALAAYVSGGLDAMIEPVDYLTKVLDFSDADARGMIERASEHAEEKQAMQMEEQQAQVDAGLAPDPVDMAEREMQIKETAAKAKTVPGLAKGVKPGAKPPVKNEETVVEYDDPVEDEPTDNSAPFDPLGGVMWVDDDDGLVTRPLTEGDGESTEG